MTEELVKLYSSEEFTSATDETKAEMTKKIIGTLTVPKDTYNELNTKYKNSDAKLQSLTSEYETYKQDKMTDAERIQAERDSLLKSQRELTLKSNTLDVVRKLEKAGLTEEDYKEQLDLIVSEDSEKSMKLADFLVSTLSKNAEKVQKETQINLLNDTPKPIVGTNTKTSNLDALKEEYSKAIKSKDTIAQAMYLRLIQEEQRKQI